MDDNTQKSGSVGIVQTRSAAIALSAGGLRLDSGECLPELTVAYETYGALTEQRDNVIFICHALTGDAHVAGHHDPDDPSTRGWWDEMVGPGKGIDTDHYFVVCANVLGGCKGTTGPSSIDPRTGKPYGSAFPPITVGDIVNVHRLLLGHLNIERLAAVVGGSFGGMQAVEWAIRYPDTIDRCICVASAASLSTQALAFDIVGRHAITSDPEWLSGDYYGSGHVPFHGLSLARKIGHITYLSPEMMTRKFGRDRKEGDLSDTSPGENGTADAFGTNFEVERYLDHQGRKFVDRFDANSYLHITRAMDEYDLPGRHGTLARAFDPIRAKFLIVALSSDWLFPPEQSVAIAHALHGAGKAASYCELRAPHGHDAFLVDIEYLSEAIRAFLPWVEQGASEDGDIPAARRDRRAMWRVGNSRASLVGYRSEEYRIVEGMVREGSRVLDLGCGNGDLLNLLALEKGVKGLGVDIDIANVIDVIDKGHDVFLTDIDAGLAMTPDGSYDYAILSETLQVVRRPRFVLQEMLRVAREGIVVFPNFATWRHRLCLVAKGKMPKGGALPFEWYNTPNIHLFSYRDFIDLCRMDNIEILDMVCIPRGGPSRLLVRAGFCNLGADRVIVKIARQGARGRAVPPDSDGRAGGDGSASCRRCAT